MNMNLLLKQNMRQAREAGIGLTECILSVGITATSLLAVIGMLMGTLKVASETREETSTGVLIRQLVGEIKDLPVAAADMEAKPMILLVDDSLKVLEHSLSPNGGDIAGVYESGSQNLAATSFARIDRVPDPANPRLDRIVIRVETPASAPAAGRTVREYAALSPRQPNG